MKTSDLEPGMLLMVKEDGCIALWATPDIEKDDKVCIMSQGDIVMHLELVVTNSQYDMCKVLYRETVAYMGGMHIEYDELERLY